MERPQSPTSPRPAQPPQQIDILSHPVNEEPSSLWDWNDDFLDFTLDDQFTFPLDSSLPPSPEPAAHVPLPSPNRFTSPDRVRKRDPRTSCTNFLAGRIPCACPEIDEKLLEEEEAGPGKKRPRTYRVFARCQVPDCEADISELKGYHRRHRVCLLCANATSVILDGHTKRYCQQCGKFHILSDFDEGKRSCRRKLERHNNRRRRKPIDSKVGPEKERQQVLLMQDVSCDDKTGKDVICLDNQVAEKESLFESEEHISRHVLSHNLQTVGSAHNSQTVGSDHCSQSLQSDSVVTFAALGEPQTGVDKDSSKFSHSPSYCDNKNSFSSVCPTGRISFKLYDWNPAEFPRRLRHQIFQWLASMPVELEGYIRPGCTILTLFIAMPRFMWVKLNADPFAFIRDFVVAPGSILSRRGTLFIHLNNMIFRVMKVTDGTSVMKVKVHEQVPNLHYVHPTCFEAGEPIEFVACGSNLLQPKFRLLLSFGGGYLESDFCLPLLCGRTESDSASGFNHQLLKIRIAHTEPNLVGPAFIEVENQSGLSNFVPILIADKDICSEMNTMQQKFDSSFNSKESQFISSGSSCEVLSLRQIQLCELIIDIGWLLKEPVLDDLLPVLTLSQIQRFNSLLNLLIQNKSAAILNRVVDNIKIVMAVRQATNTADADMQLLRSNLECARDVVCHKFKKDGNVVLDSINLIPKDHFSRGSMDEMPSIVPVTNQAMEPMEKDKLDANFLESGAVPLLNGDVLLSVTLKERPQKSCSHLFADKVLISRPLIFIVAAAAVCFGLCVVVLHPQKVGEFATTIRRCMFDNS